MIAHLFSLQSIRWQRERTNPPRGVDKDTSLGGMIGVSMRMNCSKERRRVDEYAPSTAVPDQREKLASRPLSFCWRSWRRELRPRSSRWAARPSMAAGRGSCAQTGRCVLTTASNEWVDQLEQADGIFGGYTGVLRRGERQLRKCFLDRAFTAGGGRCVTKVAAAVAAVRRTGGMRPHLEDINRFFTISGKCWWFPPTTGM